MYLILIRFPCLYSMIQFKLTQVPLNIMIKIPISRAILLWSKFYYSLFKYKEGRLSFWSIVTNPLGADYRRPFRK